MHAAVVELVDTLDSKSDEHYARAGSSPARGTIKPIKILYVSSFLEVFFIVLKVT